jgi:hypothetical protein
VGRQIQTAYSTEIDGHGKIEANWFMKGSLENNRSIGNKQRPFNYP